MNHLSRPGSGRVGYADRDDKRYLDPYYGGYSDYDTDYSADHDDYDDYDDYDDFATDPASRRWRPVAATAGGVLLAAVVGTTVIINSGGDGGTAGTIAPPATSVVAMPAPPKPVPPSAAPPATVLPRETMTTLAPAPTPPAPLPSATAAPQAGVPPAVNPRTIVYTVTGTKQLLDLVTVIYTDESGLPRTDVNVALPWTKTIVLNPGVPVQSVTATSLFGRLNCAITNAAGQPIAVAANNGIIATCTR